MKLLDFYTSLLQATGHNVTSDGYVNRDIGETRFPTTVAGGALVLPTREHLKNAGMGSLTLFHPLVEDLMRGPSEVLNYFRRAIRVEIEAKLSLLILDLLTLASRSELHQYLDPEEASFLDYVTKADEKTVTAFKRISDRLEDGDRDKMLIHLYLRKGGKIGEESFRQTTTVTFPIYEALKEDVKEFAGVKLRKADVASILGVYEYIFPHCRGINEPNFEQNSFGSRDKIAPKLHSLLLAFSSLVTDLNDEIELLRRVEKRAKSKEPLFIDTSLIESEWIESLTKFNELWKEARDIPMQRGNEGELSIHEKEYANTEDTVKVPEKQREVQQPVQYQPIQQEPTVNQPTQPQYPQQPPPQPQPTWQQTVAPQQPQYQPTPPQSAPQSAPRGGGSSVSIKDVFQGGGHPQAPMHHPVPAMAVPQPPMNQYPPHGMYPQGQPMGYPQQGYYPPQAQGQYPMPAPTMPAPTMQPGVGYVNPQHQGGYYQPVQTGLGSPGTPFGYYGSNYRNI